MCEGKDSFTYRLKGSAYKRLLCFKKLLNMYTLEREFQNLSYCMLLKMEMSFYVPQLMLCLSRLPVYSLENNVARLEKDVT